MDEDLRVLVDELRVLINTLNGLGKTQATSWERSTDKFVGAIARLNAALDKNAKTNQQRNKSIEKFTKEVEEYSKAQEEVRKKQKETMESLDDVSDAAKKAADELEGTAEGARRARNRAALEAIQEERRARYDEKATVTAQRLFEEYGRGAGVTATMRERFESLGGTSMGTTAALKMAAAGAEGFGKALMSYGKALVDGEQGMAVSANAVKEFANTIGTAAQTIGAALMFIPGFGLAVRLAGAGLSLLGTTGKLAADANKLVAEQSDRLYKTYQNLSEVGVTASDGMIGLAESANKAGFGLDQAGLETFGRLMREASTGLAMMSGSAVKGRKDFAEFSSEVVRGETGQALMNLGMSVEQINQGLVDFANLQSRVGMTQNKTTAQLAQSAASYLREMDLLSKVTGLQRKDMEDAIKRSRSIEIFRAKTEQMRRSGDERQARAALEAEKTFGALAAAGADEAAQGFAESFSGIIATDAGAKFQQMMGFQMDMADQFTSGQLDAIRAFGMISNSANDVVNGLGGDLGLVGAAGKLYGDFSQLATLSQFSGKSIEETAALMAKLQKDQEKGPGGVAAQTDMRRAQMNTRDSLQNLINLGVNPLTASMKSLSETVDDVVTGLGGRPAGGTPYSGARGTAPGGGGGGGAATGVPGSAGEMFSQAFNARREGEGGIVGAIGRGLRSLGDVISGPGGRDFYSRGGVANEQAILDFIGRVESRGNYNVLVGGKTKTDPALTDMTVAQIMEYQQTMRAKGHESTAVGKYQIVADTMDWLVGSGAISPNDVFDQSTQDRAAVALLKRRGWAQYQTGQMSREAFADSLAKEWASFPMANGKSYYGGVGSNKALVSRGELIEAISAAEGGIASGPRSGYHAILHGTEAVVPLPDGKNIPVALSMPMNMGTPSTDGLTELGQGSPAAIVSAIRSAIADVTSTQTTGGGDSTAAMITELQNIANLLARQNNTSERILQVARN